MLMEPLTCRESKARNFCSCACMGKGIVDNISIELAEYLSSFLEEKIEFVIIHCFRLFLVMGAKL